MSDTPITADAAWRALSDHGRVMADVRIDACIEDDPDRLTSMRHTIGELTVDCCKHLATAETMSLLCAVARAADVEALRDAMFAGECVNTTEQRPALHTALRHRGDARVCVDGEDVMPDVRAALDQMRAFCTAVHEGTRTGHTGARFTAVVNIGIGGSDLGPRMAVAALKPFHCDQLQAHFVSNVDPSNLSDTLSALDPATTLFIVSSKSFGTKETLTNARAARRWLADALGDDAVAAHFVAVSSNARGVAQFGIDTEHMFPMPDWVGGRYSMWGTIGLSIALATSFDHFELLLQGAYEMDEHFRTAPIEANMPMLLGLLDVWYRNIHGLQTLAVLPYDHHLTHLPAYLQQAMMESAGKRVRKDGRATGMDTSPIIWGQPGTNGQHAFHQMLHQGTTVVPCDFLVAMSSCGDAAAQHLDLVANCIAQSEALMRGRDEARVRADLAAQGMAEVDIDALAPHKVMPGNRPSTTFIYPRLTPHVFGMVVALWEHRIFTSSAIWGIDAFDQWGVELGKQLALGIRPMLDGADDGSKARDASTTGLIDLVRQHTET